MLIEEILSEDTPLRNTDPKVIKWLGKASKRPDANSLYLHGSNHDFAEFRQPKVEHGQLIFGSKLLDNRKTGAILQAEYYGHELYLVKFHYSKLFNPYGDPVAKKILINALFSEAVWDAKYKIEIGRVDYQDLQLIVPPAIVAGYDAFRVYECSIRADSYGVIDRKMVEIVERYET